MSIEEAIRTSMARMIERKEGISGVEVTTWEEEFDVYAYGAGCSCGPEFEKDYSVSIYYNVGNARAYYCYKGSFTELIRELDEDE